MLSHTKLTGWIGALSLLLVCAHLSGWGDIAGVQTAHAQAGAPLTASGMFISSISTIIGLILTVVNALTWLLFMLLDLVLNPDWIFDLQSGGLTNMLRDIWQLCRDLVNLILAITLIGGAITMIVTADNSKVKAALPKFVMALVLVNFSWFIPRAIFDLSQILTYTVYQIPSLLNANGCTLPATDTQPAQPCQIVTNYAFFDITNYIGNDGVLRPPAGAGGGAAASGGWSCPLRPFVCIQTAPIGSPAATTNAHMHTNVLNGLIVNHARLRTLIRLSDPRAGGAGPIAGGAGQQFTQATLFLVKLTIILLFHLALFFPLLAMVAAFFLRIPILWVTMAFMPLVALSYVIGDRLGNLDPKKIFMEQFIQAVFLPAKVAVPFTIGFIMVNAGASAAPPAAFGQLAPIAVFSGISSVWQIVWMVIALFIIWKYSFEALKGGPEITQMFTDRIKGFGETSFNLAKTAALSAPVIPIPGLGASSALDLSRALSPTRALNDLRAGNPLTGVGDYLKKAKERREGGKNPGAPPAPRASEIDKSATVVPTLTNKNDIEVNIKQVYQNDPALSDEQNKQRQNAALEEVLKKIRESSGNKLDGVTEAERVLGALKALGLDTNEANKELVKKALERRAGKGGTVPLPGTPTGAPPPAPGGPNP